MPIIIKLNCSRIPKERLFQGKNGKYIDLVLFENKDGADQYGNHGFVSVSLSQEERAANQRGEIVGNWKDTSRGNASNSAPPRRPAPPPQKPQDPDLDADSEEPIPF